LLSLIRAMAGQTVHLEAYLSGRQRIDFAILVLIVGTLIAACVFVMYCCVFTSFTVCFSVNAFAVLTAQIFVRHFHMSWRLCLPSA